MSDFSDSDSDYNENEKILLDNYRKRKYQSDDDDDEAVFNVAPDDEEDSDENEDILADSDIEGQEVDDDLPDEKAWGRSKKNFYTSDYVNADTEKEKDLEFAEFEAEAAKKLEAEIFDQLVVLNPDVLESDEETKDGEQGLNDRELKQVQADKDISSCLIKELKEYTNVNESFLRPFLVKSGSSSNLPNNQLTEFVKHFSDLILNYKLNISMYKLLKAEKVSTITHPIMERLEDYRGTIEKLQTVFEKSVKHRIEAYLHEEELSKQSLESVKKKLKLIKNMEQPSTKKNGHMKGSIEQMVKLTDKLKAMTADTEEQKHEEIQTNDLVKRPITYKMAKNKGLTPKRKKEQRNPRVKHRNKYNKAKIRRKGAVREVRNETKRYGGEISGINAHVLKGIKLKV